MYIANKYWNNYLGDTDDSMRLVEHLAEKQKEEILLGEILSDFGLDKLHGNFRTPDIPLVFVYPEGWEKEIHYAISLLTDLAALLLECKVNGCVHLCELFGDDLDGSSPDVRITATPEEHKWMNKVLMDFVSEPLAYNLSEMTTEEEMLQMAEICKELRKELYGSCESLPSL